jgi:hypothetical protein
VHRHRHDYVFVTLGDVHVSNQVEGKPSVDRKLSDGGTRLVAGTLPTSQSISQMGWRLPQPFILRQFNRRVAKGLVLGRRKMAKRLSSVAGAQLFS